MTSKILKNLKKIWRLVPTQVRSLVNQQIWRFFTFVRFLSLPNAKAKKSNIQTDEIYLIGLFSASLGHSTAADLLAAELMAANHKVTKIDITKLNSGEEKRLEGNFDSINKIVIFLINPDVFAHIAVKFPRKFLKENYLIGYWVWELENPPPSWKIAFSKVNEIWTPSKFSRDSLQKISDVEVKIVPHPCAYDRPIIYKKSEKAKLRKNLGIMSDEFVVVQSFAIASSIERKGIFQAIDAFEKAFAADEKACFIIRYMNSKDFPNAMETVIQRIKASPSKIILIETGKNRDELFKLYAVADIYLSLHRAEGFGLNLAEAMMIGLPVVATAYSGNLDFMNDENSFLIPYTLTQVIDSQGVYKNTNSNWAKADISIAAKILKEISLDFSLAEKKAKNAKKSIIQTLQGNAEELIQKITLE